jgi:nitrite reductase (NADH) small subunit
MSAEVDGGPTVDLGPIDQVPVGEGRVFDVAGRAVAVFRLRSGAVAATSAVCPHRGGPLADGIVGGEVVICPLHQRKYDLETGACLSGDDAVAVYGAHVDAEGHVHLRW